jgi:hypothetical protein
VLLAFGYPMDADLLKYVNDIDFCASGGSRQNKSNDA